MSKRTLFRAVKNLSAPSTIRLQANCFCEQSASVLSETYFTFSRLKSHAKLCAFARTFYNVNVPCYCYITWYETRTGFFSS